MKTLRVDASRPAPAPLENTVRMGANVSPDGRTIGINSRYLTRDGAPWLPVMGELHYARVPDVHWDDTLAKVESAGVDIVASYVMWRYHEPRAGTFDWSGRFDLRRFVQGCARRGLLVFMRIGPWVHAEVRYGGLPDWIVNQVPTRADDPLYLDYVRRFFDAIARQLDGLLWKEGGPVIGVQLENEYNLTGAQQGPAHIATLGRLAVDAGLDVPLYTVTGWDNAVFPHRDVTPVFGGYPDLPWGTSTSMSPPNEVYGFRFTNRVGGDLGAQTHNVEPGDADAVAHETPFLGAEFGGGVPTMYRRRPVLDPADIAAMLPVQLGSGVNLYGYYMLHGGRNPPGDLNGQESTATGGYNDLPIIHYDFQAPFGANGEAHPVLGAVRPIHLFLKEWGDALAPCAVHAPEVLSCGADDLHTPRFSVRAQGDSGFLFFNRHLRQHSMSACEDVRFSVKLATDTITLPEKPVDIAAGAFFVWPLGLTLGGARLRYATAQPVTRLDGDVYVFVETDGVAAEFAFDATRDEAVCIVRPTPGQMTNIACADGTNIGVLLLAREDAARASVLSIVGKRHLILSNALVFERDRTLVMRSMGVASFEFAVYPPFDRAPETAHALVTLPRDDAFQRFLVEVPEVHVNVGVTQVRVARAVPSVRIGGAAHAAIEPTPETFGQAGAWRIDLPEQALMAHGLCNAHLTIDYSGDIGRLFSGTNLIDDHFCNGLPWRIGVRNVAIDPRAPLTLTVLPLRTDAPIYLDVRHDPRPSGEEHVAEVRKIGWTPEYEVIVTFPSG
ncbi:beta-galactosidase [Caballeronia novacaledonica]|uniref:beta-galactosidase n=1 Tax=Caballeronia novacaledonica TaxID=1544861 RepID=UPI001FEA08AA|nr:beta-galactosidase [Caballeronia novacaledonica]